MFLDPDDFKSDPYTAGLNQTGHVVFGASVVLVLGVYVSALTIAAWELWQYYRRGSFKSDTIADVTFWSCGMALAGNFYLPVYAVIMGGIWMVVVWYRKK